MKHTKEEIINALKVIRDECQEAEECAKCPFSSQDGDCKLEEAPNTWAISDGKPPVWRALK